MTYTVGGVEAEDGPLFIGQDVIVPVQIPDELGGAFVKDVVVEDFNGDGIEDLLVVHESAKGSYRSRISVFVGKGDATFDQSFDIQVQDDQFRTTNAAVGDFNGDGVLDVALGNEFNTPYVIDGVQVFIGNGDGSLSEGAHATTSGILLRQLSAADINGDSINDLIFTDEFGDIGWMEGNGDGNFTIVGTMSTVYDAARLEVVDVNNDSIPDLVAVGPLGVEVFLGEGDGKFSPSILTATNIEHQSDCSFYGDELLALSADDFNGDGIVDLAITGDDEEQLAILSGVGDGTFGREQFFSAPTFGFPDFLQSRDLNRDGFKDVLIASCSGDLGIFLNDGLGNFFGDSFETAASDARGLALGDFNVDELVDAAVLRTSRRSYLGEVAMFLGDPGPGFFKTNPTFSSGVSAELIESGDFNCDRIPDLVVVDQFSDNISVLFGSSDSNFSLANQFSFGSSIRQIDSGDFDGDGFDDLVIVENPSQVSLLLGNGDGTFVNSSSSSVNSITDMVLADFNVDGNLDLAVSADDAVELSLFFGNGDGTFQSPVEQSTASSLMHLVVADFTGDGIPDLAAEKVTGQEDRVVMLTGSGTGVFFENYKEFGLSFNDFVAGDFDGDGNNDFAAISNWIDNSYSDSVWIYYGSGFGTFERISIVLGDELNDIMISGDVDQDGADDIVIANANSNLNVLLGGTEITSYRGFRFQDVVITDVGNDGSVDLVVANGFISEVTVMLNQQCRVYPLGDVNQDGVVNLLDVAPFIDVLVSGNYQFEADVNQDGEVNLLDVAPFIALLTGGPTSSVAAGVLAVDGLAIDDDIRVESTGNPGQVQLFSNGQLIGAFEGVNDVIVNAGTGNDAVYVDFPNATIDGGAGHDNITFVGAGTGILIGGNGNDTITGGAGPDVIEGGSGCDILIGNSGDDTIYGGADNDEIQGLDGEDTLFGDEGDDEIHGGAKGDSISGGEGNDNILGGAGADELIGEAGDDVLGGNGGDDFFTGGEGLDTFFGGAGFDTAVDDGENGEFAIEDS